MTLPLILAAVFLNGVNIDSVRSQSFEKCKTVEIDARGDVHLDCPGYEVQTAPAAPAPAAPAAVPTAAPATPAPAAEPAVAAPGALSKHYFLVTQQSQRGAAQYDVDVFVNSKWVRTLHADDDQVVLELTKYLSPGPNKVLFAATKHVEAGRKSTSKGAWLKLIVGEGESGGGKVTIDNPLVECKRTAAETDNVNEEYTVEGR